jgi:hypothetical protein
LLTTLTPKEQEREEQAEVQEAQVVSLELEELRP